MTLAGSAPSAVLGPAALTTLLGEWTRPVTPAYAALADGIRRLVLDGRVPVGARLPAERELAAALGLSRTTVAAAYAALRGTGHLASRRGSGSVTRIPSRERDAGEAGVEVADMSRAAVPAAPALADAVMRAAARLPAHLDGHGYDVEGIPELREAVAARYRARGLPTEPEDVMITVGAQHAIGLLASVLVHRGDRALVEQPSYPHAIQALRDAGARLVGVGVGADGWDEDVLEQGIRRTRPALAYLMPDFHNPTGRTMPEAQRARVVALAEAHGVTVVADETTAELDVDRPEAHPPLAVHGSPGAVVLVGSVGKTVWGGLRVGWIRAGRPLLRELARARSARDLGTPVLEQLVVAEVLGGMDGILAERRARLRETRDHVEAELARRFPGWEVPHVDGGLAVWVGIGAPVSTELALAARARGLSITGGSRFGHDGAFERFLRIPITAPPAATDRALDILEDAWRGLAPAAGLEHDVEDRSILV
ncbi:PLP-dependent aminotransferase family protein [Clavibacter tessellarius]|uniref:GntR family transcriptional regulator n=1 Tax=Clavibacter tessellarius TaxID=31965 RepID=A0A225C510_9MICO|nr:PLP-dependent aminotransferase family protein [Clavibacter michiganensis]OQJ61858.1 GntR family transcriptional regulator [Clavibacter michiganensis subsp. tessellarius]UKF35154.1 PLP-dependent aminotransferase family protein [Clavibacter michiganensis subsp. tessellarius]